MGGFESCFPTRKINLIEDKKEINNYLGLKINICGNLSEKEKVISDLFHEKYTDNETYQHKTNQFLWIAKIYPDLSEKTIDLIIDEIIKDIDKPKELKPINQQVILCFGSENINSLINKIKSKGEIYIPLFIIISEDEIKDIKLSLWIFYI